MSQTETPYYIEVTSANRNRLQYPNPSSFNVQFTPSTTSSSSDQVSSSSILYPQANQLIHANKCYGFGVIPGYAYDSHAPGLNQLLSILPVLNDQNALLTLETPATAFIGSTLELLDEGNNVGNPVQYRTITNVQKILGGISVSGTVTTVLTVNSFILSVSAINLNDFFVGWTLVFTNTTDLLLSGVTRTITGYRAYDGTIFFEPPIEFTITMGDSFHLMTDNYQLTFNQPFTGVAIPTLNHGYTQTNYLAFRIRGGSPLARTTVTAGATNKTIITATDIPNYNATLKPWIWFPKPVVLATSLIDASTNTTFQGQPVLSIFPTASMVGMYILFTTGAFTGYSYMVTAWDNPSLTGTIGLNWSNAMTTPGGGDTFEIIMTDPKQYYPTVNFNEGLLTTTISSNFQVIPVAGGQAPINYIPPNGTLVEYLPITTQQGVTVDHPKSMVSTSQSVCHELTLVSITIPVTKLVGLMSVTILDLPYVYVKFHSRDTSAYDFVSNNPLVKKCLWKAPVINYRSIGGTFLTLDGHGMNPTVKFRPNDNFDFQILTPTGELLAFQQQDNIPPANPDVNLQITLTLQVR